MKQLVITIFILSTIFGPVIYAANEIRAIAPGVSTLYHTVREIDGDIWYVSGQVFEVFGTAARTMADYDVAMVDKSAGFFVGTMDTNIGAGQYYVVSHQQKGGSPADSDPAIWQEYGDWDGSTWIPTTITPADVADAVWDELSTDHLDAGKAGEQQWTDVDAILVDTNELQTDWTNGGRLDLLIDLIKYKTDLISLVDTVVKDSNDANNFTIEDGTDVNDAYWFMAVQVEDADDNLSKEIRWINFYDENSGDPNIWVDEPFSFTPAVGDVVHVMGTTYGGFLYRIMKKLDQTKGVLNVIDRTKSGTGGLDRAGAIRIDALGDDP